MWCLVKTVANFEEDPEVIAIFEDKHFAIGEMLKMYIKANTYNGSQTLEPDLIKLKKRFQNGDTNDILIGKYKYSIVFQMGINQNK